MFQANQVLNPGLRAGEGIAVYPLGNDDIQVALLLDRVFIGIVEENRIVTTHYSNL